MRDFSNLRAQENRFQSYKEELNNLGLIYEEAREEEQKHKENTILLEDQAQHLSILYQNETQNLKQLEHEMYKQLITEKIHDLNVDSIPNQTLKPDKSTNETFYNKVSETVV